MIFALGTPVNARCRPWTFDWAIKPDAIMISAIDFLSSPRLLEAVKKKGIHEYLGWEGQIICDSGFFCLKSKEKSSSGY
jgi:queuine/archaeosine tRNA-ribosyltransferase